MTDRKQRSENIVLVADDDLFIRTVVSRVLGDKTKIIEAQTGANVMVLYEQHMPDIVILDVYMPEISGWDLLDSICARDPEAFVVMFSGDRCEENRKKAIQSGAQGFIGKPFDPEALFYYLLKCRTFYFSDGTIAAAVDLEKKNRDGPPDQAAPTAAI